jgi:hypothetical protein
MGNTFTHIEGRPIWWAGSDGKVHVCEGSDIHRGVRIFWTMCERDVPANTAFLPASDDRVTCEKCLQVIRIKEEEEAQERHDNSQFGVGA